MATITEDYISFETAKLLKEKGFKTPVETGYYGDGRICHNLILDFMDYNHEDGYYSRPTIQMAMKWLLREYRLYVNVVPSVEGYYWTEKWHSYVEDLNKRYPYGKFIGTFNSPEEAYEAAIKYTLENLI